MLKFGQTVDIETLDTVGVNKVLPSIQPSSLYLSTHTLRFTPLLSLSRCRWPRTCVLLRTLSHPPPPSPTLSTFSSLSPQVAEDLRCRIEATEAKHAEEVRALKRQLAATKAELKDVTVASTEKLTTVAALFERQQKLEAELNRASAAAVTDTAAERRERQRLVQLVKVQAKEVEALKLEINMLRRKGGHAYSAPAAHA